ncbi:WD40 repeat-like protein [Trametes gibbosa]|nr:WD40 repeat-like protein [Trametes gibbosa]
MYGGRSGPRLWNAVESYSTAVPTVLRRRAIDDLMAGGLPYSGKLLGHTSCVNSLAISKDGRWLASAGDDPNVYLWDFNQEIVSKPSWGFVGPRANVFTLAFSASGLYLYSGDTRADIFQYDMSHLTSPTASRTRHSRAPSASDSQHDESIRAISCHPVQDHIFLSAAEDGRVILHDMRTDARHSGAQGLLQQIAPFSSVQYHPTMSQIFATSDSQGEVWLRDARMAFGPLAGRHRNGGVHKVRTADCGLQAIYTQAQYVTTIAERGGGRMARPEASSLAFDMDGRRLALTILHHHSTLYAIDDSYPIATFSGRHNPDGSPVLPGEPTWSNSCTMKHGSFGGFGSDRETYYAHGSDDFQTYLWNIPDDTAALRDRRVVVEADDWYAQTHGSPGEVGYAQSSLSPRYIPVELSVPHARLRGHDSIVNSALIHPTRPYLLTAGIERFIRLHSPHACAPYVTRTPPDVRAVPASDPDSRMLLLRAMGIIDDPGPGHEEDEGGPEGDDRQTIALFDQILRAEGGRDVFALRAFGGGGVGDSDSDAEMADSDQRSDGGIEA